MRRTFCFLFVILTAALASAQTRATKTLDIYVVDVEGRQRDAVRGPVRRVAADRHR